MTSFLLNDLIRQNRKVLLTSGERIMTTVESLMSAAQTAISEEMNSLISMIRKVDISNTGSVVMVIDFEGFCSDTDIEALRYAMERIDMRWRLAAPMDLWERVLLNAPILARGKPVAALGVRASIDNCGNSVYPHMKLQNSNSENDWLDILYREPANCCILLIRE